jgi:tetratricopeptide (TPR) repeat protein
MKPQFRVAIAATVLLMTAGSPATTAPETTVALAKAHATAPPPAPATFALAMSPTPAPTTFALAKAPTPAPTTLALATAPTPAPIATPAPTAVPAQAGHGYTYVHHPVSTDLPAAQFAFDRGLTMFFAYQPEEAEVAFREAARLDPGLAMAWWGVGLAIGPNINEQPTAEKTAKAADALARATLLAKAHATESEMDYVNTLSTRYTSEPSPDFDKLTIQYRDEMRALVKKYPADADARALFAEAIMDLHPWRLWHPSGDPEVGTDELVQTLEEGLAAQPNHIGLLHFYIHAVEASHDPGRALQVARRLTALPMEPAAAHLVHMPAHIYMRVGDWESAVQSNEHATHHALDYRLSNNPKAQHACGHCADFLSYAYMMQGNLAHARQASENYQKMVEDPTNTIAVLVRFGRWDEILAFPEPDANAKSDAHNAHATRGFWHFARGMAFAGKRQSDKAQDELSALRAESALAPGEASFDGAPDVQHVLDKLSQTGDAYNLKIEAAILGSRIAEAQRRFPESIELMRTAVKLQDEAPYGEPPPWFYPVRESLGALVLRHGSAAESVAVFTEGLRLSPNDPRALVGLAAALGAAGRKADAAAATARFNAVKQFADVPLSVKDL